MKRYLAIACLLLAGCITPGVVSDPDTSPATRYAAARLDLNALLATVVTYAELPACTEAVPAGCSEPVVVQRALDFGLAADQALDAARVAIDGGGDGVEQQILLATSALRQLQAIISAQMVKAIEKRSIKNG